MNVCFPFLTGSFSKSYLYSKWSKKETYNFVTFICSGIESGREWMPLLFHPRNVFPIWKHQWRLPTRQLHRRKWGSFRHTPKWGPFHPGLHSLAKKLGFNQVFTQFHTGAKPNFLSRNCQEFDVWKMWILWKMRLWKCEFCRKYVWKMWNWSIMRFHKCEFC